MNPRVGVVMGSSSDWSVMKDAVRILDYFEVSNEYKVVSAHRTPELLYRYASSARSRGIQIIIAGAGGGAAHLPGMVASLSTLPVVGVPLSSESLLSVVDMPHGIPVASVGVGKAGNAALLAITILALGDDELKDKLDLFRADQTAKVKKDVLLL